MPYVAYVTDTRIPSDFKCAYLLKVVNVGFHSIV